MAKAPIRSGQSHHGPELRIVLIGGRFTEFPSGKSSAGNIILGQHVFDTSRRTAQSEARQQEVFSRPITVVDSPGWWWFYSSENTPKLDQAEIQNSVHLCPPGPHVFLLVVPVKLHLSQLDKLSLQEHLELFNADVWRHTIVLFTTVDPCSDEMIESKIQRSPVLQWILQQCGNRKHVLNIRNMEDRDQVKMLLQKIDSMVSENRGRLYCVDRADGENLRKEMKVWTEKASKRFHQVQEERKKLRALIEGGKVPPDHFRLVIIGAQYAAKSSSGNTILGKNAFEITNNGKRTTRCEISHGVVENRRLTVVDSPGWYYNHNLQDTSETDKLEIESSMNLCPPGPHAVLLVIVLATATNALYLRSVQAHVSLFTEEIWKHTIVLFTRGDWLGVKAVEERIESEEGLQWIVNKCENRYHVLNNMDQDQTQVEELLQKIEEIWAGNENPYYEVDLRRAKLLEDKKEAEDKKVRRMKKITERQTRVMKELMGGERHRLDDIKIILTGQKCSGKSTAGNAILLNEQFDLVFDTAWLKKDFQDQRRTATCVKHEGSFDRVKVTVVETPGWFRDTTPPDWIKEEVLHSVSMCAPGPHVFLLVVPLHRSFREKDLKDLLQVLMVFPERVWRHCMVLFTCGDWMNERPVEDYITREGRYIQELLEKCGNRYHVINPYRFGDPVPVKELFQKVIDMVTRNKGCFTSEEKQRTFQILPWRSTRRTLTEEEWNRREDKLIERVMRALAKEPENPTLPSVEIAHSMNSKPDMSGDVSSEYGSISESRNQRAHELVAEWLRTRVRQSEGSSGIGSMCSSGTYMENTDESPLMNEEQPTNSSSPEKEKVITPHVSMFSNFAKIRRRNSF